jgi:hypothetical protein
VKKTGKAEAIAGMPLPAKDINITVVVFLMHCSSPN